LDEGLYLTPEYHRLVLGGPLATFNSHVKWVEHKDCGC